MGQAPVGREAHPKGSLPTKPQRGSSSRLTLAPLPLPDDHPPDGPDVHRPLLHSVFAAWSVSLP